MTRSSRLVWGKVMRRRVALTLSGAGLLLIGLWWSQTRMPSGEALMQRMRHLDTDRTQLEGQGKSTVPTLLTKTRGSDFPMIVILRHDDADAAFMAQHFVDALTDASLYPRIETVLLREGQDGAPCSKTATHVSDTSNPSNSSNAANPLDTADGMARPALMYAMGDCAMRSAIASAEATQRRAALNVGDADAAAAAAMHRAVPLIFSDVDEFDARVLVPQAQRAGLTVRGVLAAPTQATQLQWARRYLPHAAAVRIGYWTDTVAADANTRHEPNVSQTSNVPAPNAAGSSLRTRRVMGLRDAAREAAFGAGRVDLVARGEGAYEDDDRDADDKGAIEIVAASGRPDEAIAHWRARGVRLLYVDRETPVALTQAAVTAGIGTFCAADTVSRAALRGTCLLQVVPLRQAAPAMAAYLASQRIRMSPPAAQRPAASTATVWQAPPQGPLQLDIALARKMGRMPPLSLLDDVRVVDVERETARPRKSGDPALPATP